MKPTRMSNATVFPDRLTDELWAILEPLVPAEKSGGRPPKYSRRAILDAICYAVRQGCTWRALPADLPHWNTVFWYFSQWQKDGTWDDLEDALRRAVSDCGDASVDPLGAGPPGAARAGAEASGRTGRRHRRDARGHPPDRGRGTPHASELCARPHGQGRRIIRPAAGGSLNSRTQKGNHGQPVARCILSL